MYMYTVLEPFPTVRQPRIHRPVIGSALTLRCRPPRSYPKPTIFWGVDNVGLQQIDTDDRITLDYNGHYYWRQSVHSIYDLCSSCASIMLTKQVLFFSGVHCMYRIICFFRSETQKLGLLISSLCDLIGIGCFVVNPKITGLWWRRRFGLWLLIFSAMLYFSNIFVWCKERQCTSLYSQVLNDWVCDYVIAGNLHIANVRMEDARNGSSYLCVVMNSELRSLAQGDDQKIEPLRHTGICTRIPTVASVSYARFRLQGQIHISRQTCHRLKIFRHANGRPTSQIFVSGDAACMTWTTYCRVPVITCRRHVV